MQFHKTKHSKEKTLCLSKKYLLEVHIRADKVLDVTFLTIIYLRWFRTIVIYHKVMVVSKSYQKKLLSLLFIIICQSKLCGICIFSLKKKIFQKQFIRNKPGINLHTYSMKSKICLKLSKVNAFTVPALFLTRQQVFLLS